MSLSKLLWGSHIQHGRSRLLDLKKWMGKMRGASNFLLRFCQNVAKSLLIYGSCKSYLKSWFIEFSTQYLAPSIYHRCFRSIAYRCPRAPSGSPAEKLPHREGDSAASHGPTQSPSHGREDHPGHQVNRGTKKGEEKWCGRRRHDQFDS